MYNSFAHGIGGAFIRPSPRQSIHSHFGCVFAERERMTRFGLNDTRQRSRQGNISAEENRGTDEVDNVMSKPANPIRYPKTKQKRRSSLELTNNGQQYDEDGEDDALSKSVPATLPSQIYFSFSTEDDDDETLVGNYNNQSANGRNHNLSNSFGSQSSGSSQKSIYSLRLEESISERGFNQRNKTFLSTASISFISVVVVLCAIVCSGGVHIQNWSVTTKYDKSNFFTDLSALGEKYSIDADSILKIQMGISTIFEKEDTGSFIFVYNSQEKNFDFREFYKFVNDISIAAAKYLRNVSTPVHYISVDGARLDMDEYSELLCRYREQLSRTGVMLLKNLEAVPSHLAMAFHYYCDEYTPLVKKSAVIFTLDLAKCTPGKPSSKTLHSTIEACLSERWTSISPDSITPLLARVVNVIVDVSSAF